MLAKGFKKRRAALALAGTLAAALGARSARAQAIEARDAAAAPRNAHTGAGSAATSTQAATEIGVSAQSAPATVRPAAEGRDSRAIAPDPPPAAPAHRADGAAGTGAPRGVVNLNTAGPLELERLPGIGPARAKAILELRGRLTRFTRLEELLRVRGIGRATFRKLRPFLTLEGETTLRE